MNRIIEYIIDTANDGKSSEVFLRELGYSSKLMSCIKKTENGIMVNNHFQYASCPLHEGDILRVLITENESSTFIPYEYKLDIIYEDEDILVVNKPADMPVHPSMGNYEFTLGNAVANYYKNETSSFVFRCINRLDRDTSGLTIIAKNPLSALFLSNMQIKREIKRTYHAVVEGIIKDAGTVDAPIARAGNSIIERCVDYNTGEFAVTHYTPISYHNDTTLLELKLETGRTHQIRVHMNYIGHPLLGDFLYNPGANNLIKRQALHSYSLEFNHPVSGHSMKLICSYPDDIKSIIL